MADACIIYHGGCRDGYTAAWTATKALETQNKTVELHAAQYGDTPPDTKNREVYILDFSYDKQTLQELCADAATVTVCDHHKTAAGNLEGFEADNATIIFDMGRSGAGITADLFDARTLFVDYIEDADLWKWALPDSRLVNALAGASPYTFDEWDSLAYLVNTDPSVAAGYGAAINKYKQHVIDGIVESTARRVVLCGFEVWVANCPYAFGSETAERLLDLYGGPFAGYWLDTPAGRKFGLRSKPGGVDVSEICGRFGGGGHVNAAGFLLDGSTDDLCLK